jgi:hypothetical protein
MKIRNIVHSLYLTITLIASALSDYVSSCVSSLKYFKNCCSKLNHKISLNLENDVSNTYANNLKLEVVAAAFYKF